MLWHVKKTERNKRCIPEEGMSHAHKACQKKREKRKKDSPYPRKKNKREMIHTEEFTHHPPKNIHTLAHLDQGL